MQRQNEINEVMRKAAAIWDNCKPAQKQHPYLIKKKLPPLGLRQNSKGQLIIPIFNISGKLANLQFISPNGAKRNLGAGIKGNFTVLTREKQIDAPLLIAEGYATAASLFVATGFTTLAAFSDGFMEDVARQARGIYPQRAIILCADNDGLDGQGRPRTRNPGVDAARQAAAAINGAVAIPPLLDERNTDFSDVFISKGPAAVKELILNSIQARAG